MSASNGRVHEQETVHHLMSRIAHRVYFLGEDERNDFIEIVRRAADFCGIKLLAWCIMTNHFHLMVYLPQSIELNEEEILRRYGALKGCDASETMRAQLAVWRQKGKDGEQDIARWCAKQRRRMYDIGEFMKIVKQWFTEEYNRRHSHVGTLWESAYQDRLVKRSVPEMSKRMGYIHLNPIRAAASASFDGYAWSSFSAFVRGDKVAVDGMRFVYDDDEASVEELSERHVMLLEELIEEEKRKMAEEIARKRAAGYDLPVDPLTTEAMIAQASAHLERIRRASEEVKVAEGGGCSRRVRQEQMEQKVFAFLKLHPDISMGAIASAMGISRPTVYRYVRSWCEQGLIERNERKDSWSFVRKQV